MTRRLWPALLKSRLACAGLLLLLFFYVAAIFAGFFSPYSPVGDEFRADFFHPPSRLGWDEDGIHVTEAGTKEKIRFFIRGWRYRILWFIESDLHLFGTQGRPVFLLGSDQLGRDIFSRILFGAQVSLFVGLGGVMLTTVLGLFFGGISGYYGGKIDSVIMRLAEILMSIPALYLLLSLRNMVPNRLQDSYEKIEVLATGTFAWQQDLRIYFPVIAFIVLVLSYYNYRTGWTRWRICASVLLLSVVVWGQFLFEATFELLQRMLPGSAYVSTQWTYAILVAILSMVGWAGMSRVVRGMVLSQREEEYVLAAKSLGSKDGHIIFRHVLPNVTGYVIVRGTLLIPAYILAEVSLSFLGLGVQEPAPSWGNMLSAAQDLRVLQQYTWMLSPGVFLFLAILAFNFVGDCLRDALDPRSGT